MEAGGSAGLEGRVLGEQQTAGPWRIRIPWLRGGAGSEGSGHVLTSSKGIRLCW